MRKKLLLIILVVIMLVGCQNTAIYDSLLIEVSDATMSEEKTPYYITIEEETIYFTAEQEDVAEIIDIVVNFGNTLNTRSYDTMDGREGYEFVSPELAATWEEEEDPRRTVSYYVAKQLSQEAIDTVAEYVKFEKSGERATVTILMTCRVFESTEIFEEEMNVVDGVYTYRHVCKLIKTENGWLIYKVT